MLLASRLIQNGQMPEADRTRLAEALAANPEAVEHQVIIDRGFAREYDVLQLLSEDFGMPLIDITQVKIDPATLSVMPTRLGASQATHARFSRENGTLTVATGDPFDAYALDELAQLTGLEVAPVLASPREITRLIKTHFGVGGETVQAMVADRDEVELLEELDADDSELARQAKEASVVKLVNEILIEAVNERASDIHIEPEEKTLRIRYRIDGLLQIQRLPPEITRFQNAIISRLKIMARLNIAEKRSAAGRAHQDARAGPRDRRARVDHPDDPRRGHCDAAPRQGPHELQPRQLWHVIRCVRHI